MSDCYDIVKPENQFWAIYYNDGAKPFRVAPIAKYLPYLLLIFNAVVLSGKNKKREEQAVKKYTLFGIKYAFG